MATIHLTLPDALAQDAAKAGLLAPERVEAWLREQLRQRSMDRLFDAIDRMDQIDDLAPMTPEEIAEEIASMREEKRGSHRA